MLNAPFSSVFQPLRRANVTHRHLVQDVRSAQDNTLRTSHI